MVVDDVPGLMDLRQNSTHIASKTAQKIVSDGDSL
jgi:hypothetical protein